MIYLFTDEISLRPIALLKRLHLVDSQAQRHRCCAPGEVEWVPRHGSRGTEHNRRPVCTGWFECSTHTRKERRNRSQWPRMFLRHRADVRILLERLQLLDRTVELDNSPTVLLCAEVRFLQPRILSPPKSQDRKRRASRPARNCDVTRGISRPASSSRSIRSYCYDCSHCQTNPSTPYSESCLAAVR